MVKDGFGHRGGRGSAREETGHERLEGGCFGGKPRRGPYIVLQPALNDLDLFREMVGSCAKGRRIESSFFDGNRTT